MSHDLSPGALIHCHVHAAPLPAGDSVIILCTLRVVLCTARQVRSCKENLGGTGPIQDVPHQEGTPPEME